MTQLLLFLSQRHILLLPVFTDAHPSPPSSLQILLLSLLFYFFPPSHPVSLFLFLIHLPPSGLKPVKHPLAFLFSRVSHESGRPSSHPRGHGGTLRSASLKIKHIKSSNGRFPSPPPPSFHRGVTFFSFYTSLHSARLYSCPSEEEEGGGGGFSYIPSPVSILHCPSVYLSLPSFFTSS